MCFFMKTPDLPDSVPARLELLVQQHGITFAQLSHLLGRNAAYVQQFIKRGTPRKLDEEDRIRLGRFFGLAPEYFAPDHIANAVRKTQGDVSFRMGIIDVPRFDIRASAGAGALTGDEGMVGSVGFDAKWLRNLGAIPAMLSIIRADGHSMTPIICDGDDLLVDRTIEVQSGQVQSGQMTKKSGIFVLRMDDVLMVKRVQIDPDMPPETSQYSIISENPEFPSWHNVDSKDVRLIGRVIWFGRNLA